MGTFSDEIPSELTELTEAVRELTKALADGPQTKEWAQVRRFSDGSPAAVNISGKWYRVAPTPAEAVHKDVVYSILERIKRGVEGNLPFAQLYTEAIDGLQCVLEYPDNLEES